MKPRDELNSIDRAALHEAGHVAACIILDLEFDTVYLEPSKEHAGLVAKLARKANIDYSSGVLTPEEEVVSTNLVIVGFAGPACDALHRGRTAFDITEYEDLDEVLDSIEHRFANNNVRIAFTHYCEAEAFALFEDDRRLWRFAHVLARELSKQKKLTYAQCTELYSKEYLAESWVRKEVDEIRRQGEAKAEEGKKEEGGIAANYEQRAASIERGPQGKAQDQRPGNQDERRKGQEPRQKSQGGGREVPLPLQEQEAPKPGEVLADTAGVAGRPEEEGGQQGEERRGKRRRRGRGRGRGRGKRKEDLLEQLPGEIIGGQPVAEEPSDRGQGASEKAQDTRPRGQETRVQGAGNRGQVAVAQVQGSGVVAGQGQNNPAPAGEAPKPEERVKKQIIKAIKPPVVEDAPPLQAAADAKPAVVPVPQVALQRPVEVPPVVAPPVLPKEELPAVADQPTRRPAKLGKKAEGESVSGGNKATHPDSIWKEDKQQGAGNREQGTRNRAQGTGNKEQATSNKAQGLSDKEQGARNKAQGAGAADGSEKGANRTKAAKPRATKAANAQSPAPKPAGKGGAAAAPAAPKKAPAKSPKAARPAKAAKTATKAAPAAPVKNTRPAPAKKAAPAKGAAPKKAAAKKSSKKGE